VETLDELLLLAFPDRVCRRRSPDTATLVEGGGVRLQDPSTVRGDWFLALGARRGGFARHQQADASLVASIEVDWLDGLLRRHVVVERTAEWDTTRVVAVRRKRYRDLVIDEQRSGEVEPAAAARALAGAVDLDALAEADETFATLRRRLAMVERHLPAHLRPEGDPPDARQAVDDAASNAVAAGDASLRGITRRLAEAFHNRLFAGGWWRAIDGHAPTHVTVPTGSKIRLDWLASDPAVDPPRGPVLAVRLQELFGSARTPRVCGGTVPVTLQLLAPNMRPQQITDDLASFWRNTYPQVRKDLRARYPKHAWPEDPLRAEPLRGAQRRRGVGQAGGGRP
jgi:ATP-dependent helicase HrpB